MVENKEVVKQIGRFDEHEDARVRKLTNEIRALNLSLVRIANGLADICGSLASLESRFVEEEPTDERDSALRNLLLGSTVTLVDDQAERQSKRQEARGGEPVLVEASIPLECIGVVRCDFDGIYHVQVFGKEVVTDKETYERVVEARDAYFRRLSELGVEADT